MQFPKNRVGYKFRSFAWYKVPDLGHNLPPVAALKILFFCDACLGKVVLIFLPVEYKRGD